MFRFTIRDLLWLMVVAVISYAYKNQLVMEKEVAAKKSEYDAGIANAAVAKQRHRVDGEKCVKMQLGYGEDLRRLTDRMEQSLLKEIEKLRETGVLH